MDELEHQIAAWGDAVMAGEPDAVTAADIRRLDGTVGHPHRGVGGRWLVAVVVLAVLGVAGAGVVSLIRSDPPDRVTTADRPTDSTPEPSRRAGSGPVPFEVIGVGRGAAHDDPSQQVAT